MGRFDFRIDQWERSKWWSRVKITLYNICEEIPENDQTDVVGGVFVLQEFYKNDSIGKIQVIEWLSRFKKGDLMTNLILVIFPGPELLKIMK
mgnify:CR=1 FL=1